jgi:RNA polymerase sigma factor (sigma-70 family)
MMQSDDTALTREVRKTYKLGSSAEEIRRAIFERNEDYLDWSRRVSRLVKKFYGEVSLQEQEECSQEILLKLYKILTESDATNQCHIFGLLEKLVRGVCWPRIRTRKSRQKKAEVLSFEDMRRQFDDKGKLNFEEIFPDKGASNPEELARKKELARRVRDQIGKLSPRKRDLLNLVDVQECSYKEAAELLGLSLGRVRSLLNEARLEARNALRDLKEELL